MATIIQVNRVNTNRVNARTDTITQLQGSTALTGGALDAIHIPNLPATRINSGTFDAGRIPSLNASIINAGTISASRLPLGSNFQIQSDGTIRANPINLSNVITFDNPQERNDAIGPNDVASASSADGDLWHEGDVAIVTSSGDVTEGGSTPVSSNYAVLGPPSSTDPNQFIVIGGFDRPNNVFRSDLPDVTDVVRFNSGGNNFRGSTTGGIDFVITARERTNVGNDQVTFTVDRALTSPTTVPALAGAETVFFGAGGTTTPDVSSGTYIYTGDTQTTAAATDQDDWTLLQVPGSSISTLGESEIVIQPGAIPSGVTGTAAAGLTVIPANIFPGMTAFPSMFYLYVNGIKIARSEITVNAARTSFTLGSAVLFPPSSETNRGLTFEITFLS